MVAEFEFIGNVGKTFYSNKEGKTFFSVSLATWSYYNREKRTQWVNNIYFFGAIAGLAEENVGKGTFVRIKGKISVKTKKGSHVSETYFIATEFNVLNRGVAGSTQEEREKPAEIRSREDSDFDSEDYYNRPEIRDEPF